MHMFRGLFHWAKKAGLHQRPRLQFLGDQWNPAVCAGCGISLNWRLSGWRWPCGEKLQGVVVVPGDGFSGGRIG